MFEQHGAASLHRNFDLIDAWFRCPFLSRKGGIARFRPVQRLTPIDGYLLPIWAGQKHDDPVALSEIDEPTPADDGR